MLNKNRVIATLAGCVPLILFVIFNHYAVTFVLDSLTDHLETAVMYILLYTFPLCLKIGSWCCTITRAVFKKLEDRQFRKLIDDMSEYLGTQMRAAGREVTPGQKYTVTVEFVAA